MSAICLFKWVEQFPSCMLVSLVNQGSSDVNDTSEQLTSN